MMVFNISWVWYLTVLYSMSIAHSSIGIYNMSFEDYADAKTVQTTHIEAKIKNLNENFSAMYYDMYIDDYGFCILFY